MEHLRSNLLYSKDYVLSAQNLLTSPSKEGVFGLLFSFSREMALKLKVCGALKIYGFQASFQGRQRGYWKERGTKERFLNFLFSNGFCRRIESASNRSYTIEVVKKLAYLN